MAELIRAPGQSPMLAGAVVAGDLVYTSGVIDPAVFGAEEPPFAAQAAGALSALLAVLADAGTDSAHVVKLEAFLADPADFAAWNAEYLKIWPEPGPARTTIVVGFAMPAARIEIQAVAVLP
ncbi:RidA family protein [Gryllotalpicola sp.]|uniref:RidA family protein n=1 Tax=Gryllotalpicola sp. TaxID=1932787 RepID=UPI00262F2D78|nr:RidA family protein [Gryllotalpicola sp.]